MSEIKIHICDVGSDGLSIDESLDASFIGLTEDDYLKLIAPVRIQAKVERVDDTLFVHCTTQSRYESFCARSLEKVERDWQERFTLDFEIQSKQEYIDISEDIRQEIIIRLPTKVLSDAEINKEQAEPAATEVVESESKTYQPFANLEL